MANEENEEHWDLKLRQDTEQEFFTELALHEAERWIQVSYRESCKCYLLNNIVFSTVIDFQFDIICPWQTYWIYINVYKNKYTLV